jgi:hypothetical protein
LNEVSNYRALPGSAPSFSVGFTRNSLWLGNDHVLFIKRHGYVEDYKRFYFKDIQAILIRRTSAFVVLNMVFGVLLLSCLILHYLGAMAWGWDPIGHVFLGIWTVLLFLMLGINIIKGPTCSTSLHTAVHAEQISSMSRTRSSLRTMEILKHKIEEVQGQLTEEVLLQHPNIQAPPVILPPPIGVTTKKLFDGYKGGTHLALFLVMLLDAVVTLISIFDRNKIYMFAGTFVSGALWILLLMALVKQRHADLPRMVTSITWGVLIFGAIYYGISYFTWIVAAMQYPQYGGSQWEMIKRLWEMSPLDHPGILFLYIISIVCSLSLAIPGLIILLRSRNIKKMQPVREDAV